MDLLEKLRLLDLAEPLFTRVLLDRKELRFLSAFGKGEVEAAAARLLEHFILSGGGSLNIAEEYWLTDLVSEGYCALDGKGGVYPTERLLRKMLDNIEKILEYHEWAKGPRRISYASNMQEVIYACRRAGLISDKEAAEFYGGYR